LYGDEWLDIRVADVELPDGRRLDHRLIRTPPGAGVAAVDDAGRVLLIWRHRFITDTWGWEVPPTPGISDSRHHVYTTSDATRVGEPDGIESERVEWVRLSGLAALIERGDMASGTTVAALLYLQSKTKLSGLRPCAWPG
jgi:hypothetical protein